MKQETITHIKLVAAEGMMLYNGTTFCKEVYLGRNGDPKKWMEITEDEAHAIQAQEMKDGDIQWL